MTPWTVRGVTLRNRIVMSPMGRGFGTDGVPHADYPAYYRRRAEGGAGLVMSGAIAIGHPAAPFDQNEPHFHGAAALDMWRKAVAAVHEVGGHFVPQIWHAGLHGLAYTPPPWPQMGPSGVWFPSPGPDGKAGPSRIVGAPMTESDIAAVVSAFGDAAENAQRLGFDGVEIHGGHGSLIDQFFWDRTNLRTDGYGGDLRRRTRFAVEVISECRRRVGPGFPIFMRISQFKMMDYTAQLAATPGELADWLEPLADAGIDLFDCSQRRFWQPVFPDSALNLAGWVKKITGRPTMTCGGVGLGQAAPTFGDAGAYTATAVTSTEDLDRISGMLDRGEVDLVAVARAVLGDPAWAAKIREGRAGEVVPFTDAAFMSLA
ncbi:MAG: 12-oxophytodienoate reductase [Rhodospirillaceae bacterium]|nr:12-oxophytodienoate reductase [Rhodospirillaceae bacterium]